MDDTQYTWSFTSPSINVNKIIRGEPYISIISEDHANSIGCIVLVWSDYLENLRIITDRMIFYFKIEIPSNERRSYAYKLKASIDALSDKRLSNIKIMLDDIYEKTEHLSNIRNSLVHGSLSWGARHENEGMVSTVKTKRRFKSKIQSFDLSHEDLENNYYLLSNLCGRLHSIIGCDDAWVKRVFTGYEINFLKTVFGQSIGTGGMIVVMD